MQQRLQLIYNVAKSEVQSLHFESDMTVWTSLSLEVDHLLTN
jgi:hypothetical protein